MVTGSREALGASAGWGTCVGQQMGGFDPECSPAVNHRLLPPAHSEGSAHSDKAAPDRQACGPSSGHPCAPSRKHPGKPRVPLSHAPVPFTLSAPGHKLSGSPFAQGHTLQGLTQAPGSQL